MNLTIPRQPRSGCPDLERLAAFVDGKLPGSERAEIVAHLADCDACREIVAESAALRDEIQDAGERRGRVVEFPKPKRGRAWIAVAAAAILIAVGANLLLYRFSTGDRTGSTLATLAVDPAVRSALGEGWSEPKWSVMRGEGPIVSEPARAFRLGARAAALEVALGAGDRVAARRLAAESALLLSDVPLADPVAHVYRTIADALASESAVPGERAADAETGARLAREAVDPDLWVIGRWAETGRLLAASGSSIALPAPPRTAAPIPAELAAIVEPLRKRARRPAPRELAFEFEQLLAAGGDLR